MEVYYNLESFPRLENAVVTIGSFDGVHLGHMTLIDQVISLAKDAGGPSVVVTFDPHPRLILEINPENFGLLTSLDEKIKLIADCGVDYLFVVPFDTAFSKQSAKAYLHDFLVHHVNPRTIVVGYDHRYGAGRKGDFELMEKELSPLGIRIVEIDPLLIDRIAVSSSSIRRALASGNIEKVNSGLGYEYTITGKVTHGDKIGRTLGFPTANLEITEQHKALPKDGIYLTKVIIEDKIHHGLAYIGHRPSINSDLLRAVEVYIYDFDSDIYGSQVTLKLIDFIREDRKIDGLDALKAQMEEDKEAGRRLITGITPSNKNLAVVVLNYNGAVHLRKYMPDLIKYSPQADIVLADNCSTDDSLDYLKTLEKDIKIIMLDQNYGFTGGYNRAIASISHPYVLLLNSDVRVTEDWLIPLLSLIEEDPSIGAIQPKMLNDREPALFDYAGASGGWMDRLGYPFCRGRIFGDIESDGKQYDDRAEIFWATGAAMLTRTELYKKLGGLDEYFFAHMEEIDLCWRMKNAGYKIMVEPASKVYHYGGGTLDASSPRKTYLNFRNSLFVLLKNEQHKVWSKIFARLCLDGIAGIRFFLQGKFSFVSAILKAHFNFYANIGRYMKARKLISVQPLNSVRPLTGKYDGLIISQYFIKGKKKFSDIIIENNES